MSRGEDECNEGGGEEHLDNSDVAIVAAEYPGEGIGVVDAKALRGTDSQAAVVLVEGDEVETWVCHVEETGRDHRRQGSSRREPGPSLRELVVEVGGEEGWRMRQLAASWSLWRS